MSSFVDPTVYYYYFNGKLTLYIGSKQKMMGCFNPNLGQIWTNPNVGLKMQLKKCTVESES